MSGLKAVVIAIGDEMTSGAKLDTNTQWICQRLAELGIDVRTTATIGDDLEDNIQVFKDAARRVDFIVASGGLGPTADDLTREALAAVSDKPLTLHEPSLRHIESLFADRGRVMPPRNRCQAMLPESATEIFNPRGTAPGIDIIVPQTGGRPCRIFALPGVPAEMKELFTDVVAPRISDAIAGHAMVIRTAVIKCFGLGESEIESRLGNMISRQSSPRVGITVSAATISLRICATAANEAVCLEAIEAARAEIYAKVGDFIFGEGEAFELQHAVAGLLSIRNETLETVEVGHASPIAGWLAAASPRNVFERGVVLLDRSITGLSAEQTAAYVREKATADWLLYVDSYPSLGDGKEVLAEVTVTIAGRVKVSLATKTFCIGGHPSIIHARIGKTAMAFFRQHLLDLSTASMSRP